jgi:hypothetical protein
MGIHHTETAMNVRAMETRHAIRLIGHQTDTPEPAPDSAGRS